MTGIRIDGLNQILNPDLGVVFPIMSGGRTYNLTLQQVSDLIIALVVDGSPEALNTLDELSAALNDDENFGSTVTTALAARLKLDGTVPMTGALDMGGNDIQNVSNLVGMVGFFPNATPFPGWLKANGAAVSRTSYARLFSAIGTTYGVGDGSTTFNLPDLRGEFLRVWDDGRGIDSGRTLGSAQSDEFESHWHATPFVGNLPEGSSNTIPRHAYGDSGITSSSIGQTTEFTFPTGNYDAEGNEKAYRTNSVGGASETRPRNIALLACIKF